MDYSENKAQPGDNSNTQYALLGLNAASEAGVPVKPEVWALSRGLLGAVPEPRRRLGDTRPGTKPSDRQHDLRGHLQPDHRRLQAVPGAGIPPGRSDPATAAGGGQPTPLLRGIDWLASHFEVGENFGHGQQWKYYYLYGMERAGRLAGMRFFGEHDWYREGAEELVHDQNPLRVLARAAVEENRAGRDQLRAVVPGQGPGARC